MSSEEIIENLGPFGHWQRVIFVCLSLPDILVAFAILLPVFTGVTPDWTCAGINLNTTSYDEVGDNAVTLAQEVETVTMEISGNNSCDCKVKVFEGDITSIVTEFDLVCGKRFVSEMITSITFGGLLVGAALFGQLSDTFGRKKTFFTTITLLSICSLISSFSVNWQMYAVFRFLTGFSAGGYFCISCVYPLEFVGRRWRTLCGTLGVWAIGEMILALLAYFIRSWRHLTICTSVVGFAMFAFWWIIPDSPRWLARSGHIDEAHKVYNKIAKKNGLPPPDLSHLDKLVAQRDANEKLTKKYTYFDLFKTKQLVKLTLFTVALWFVTFVTYYNISFNLKNLSGDRYLNMFFAGFVDLFAMISVIVFNNIIGRRISLITYLGIALAGHVIILILYIADVEVTYAIIIKVSALIGKASALAGTYVTQIWSAELFPTHIRNLGVGMGSSACRVGSLLAPQVVVLGYYFELAPYILIIALCCLVIPLCFLLEETNGKALQDDIESEDATQTTEEIQNQANESTHI